MSIGGAVFNRKELGASGRVVNFTLLSCWVFKIFIFVRIKLWFILFYCIRDVLLKFSTVFSDIMKKSQ